MSCTERGYGRVLALGAIALGLSLGGCASRPAAELEPLSVDGGGHSFDAERELASFQAALGSMNQNQLEEAANRFRAIAKARPELAGPWVNLAIVDIRQNRLEQAAKNAGEALARNPRLAQAHGIMGYVATAQGDVHKALEHYRRAVELKKDYAVAHYNIALIHDLYLNDMATAATHYRLYLASTPADKKTADWLAEIERGLGQPK